MNEHHTTLITGGILVLIGFFLGYFISSGGSAALVEEGLDVDKKVLKKVFSLQENDAVLGDASSKILIVEYSDFECPFCQRIHETLGETIKENKDVAWIYRHNPLSFHPSAMDAAIISECVLTNLGNEAFWQFADTVFLNQTNISKGSLISLGKQIGLSDSQIEQCSAEGSDEIQKIATHIAHTREFGFSGTPGGVIYNTKTSEIQIIPGALPKAQLQTLIEEVR